MIPHPSRQPETIFRRQAEFDAAETRGQVDVLMKRWELEDRVVEQAETVIAKNVNALAAEVANLNRRAERTTQQLLRICDKLIDRIERLEQQQIKFAGVHQTGKTYSPNTIVIKRGQAWIAKEHTDCAPGGNDAWMLMLRADKGVIA
jgi:hypothetical protein